MGAASIRVWIMFGVMLAAGWAGAATPPNIVLIFCDDLGWGDVGCFGARSLRTPHLDRLARSGVRYTSFYVSQPVCSASRASLLTGCYANRIGIHGALPPQSPVGLSTNEWTIARLLERRGYATAMFGKWHLGRPPRFLPRAHGFQEFHGIPYSHDMWPRHPEAKPGTYPPLPLLEGDQVVDHDPDPAGLTRRFTERAVKFIDAHRHQPFFLYLAHPLPHTPLGASSRFAGRSRGGLFGDVIEELDDSVGQVLDALHRNKLDNNTWVIFTSDNGPWTTYGNHAGSSGPFREGKASVFEGGVRVPCIMRWPGKLPSGRTVDIPLMSIDLLPTIAAETGCGLPMHAIDGRNVWPQLRGDRRSVHPQEAYFFYYNTGELQAMRSGDWKLLFPHRARGLRGRPGGTNGIPVRHDLFEVGLELYDLRNDPGETVDLAARNPDVVNRLVLIADRQREKLGDGLLKTKGSEIRAAGRTE